MPTEFRCDAPLDHDHRFDEAGVHVAILMREDEGDENPIERAQREMHERNALAYKGTTRKPRSDATEDDAAIPGEGIVERAQRRMNARHASAHKGTPPTGRA